jgi:hypothetical protein
VPRGFQPSAQAPLASAATDVPRLGDAGDAGHGRDHETGKPGYQNEEREKDESARACEIVGAARPRVPQPVGAVLAPRAGEGRPERTRQRRRRPVAANQRRPRRWE